MSALFFRNGWSYIPCVSQNFFLAVDLLRREKKNSCTLRCYGSRTISKAFVTHQARANQRGFSVSSPLQKGVAEKLRHRIAAHTSDLLCLAKGSEHGPLEFQQVELWYLRYYVTFCVWAYLRLMKNMQSARSWSLHRPSVPALTELMTAITLLPAVKLSVCDCRVSSKKQRRKCI